MQLQVIVYGLYNSDCHNTITWDYTHVDYMHMLLRLNVHVLTQVNVTGVGLSVAKMWPSVFTMGTAYDMYQQWCYMYASCGRSQWHNVQCTESTLIGIWKPCDQNWEEKHYLIRSKLYIKGLALQITRLAETILHWFGCFGEVCAKLGVVPRLDIYLWGWVIAMAWQLGFYTPTGLAVSTPVMVTRLWLDYRSL